MDRFYADTVIHPFIYRWDGQVTIRPTCAAPLWGSVYVNVLIFVKFKLHTLSYDSNCLPDFELDSPLSNLKFPID